VQENVWTGWTHLPKSLKCLQHKFSCTITKPLILRFGFLPLHLFRSFKSSVSSFSNECCMIFTFISLKTQIGIFTFSFHLLKSPHCKDPFENCLQPNSCLSLHYNDEC
jgi:hypothetical protein